MTLGDAVQMSIGAVLVAGMILFGIFIPIIVFGNTAEDIVRSVFKKD